MLKKTLYGVLWAARGTATFVGLAVMMAVVLGVGTAALAAVPGDPFKLGRANVVNALTQLTGSNAGPVLRVVNGSSAANARALSLEVRPGRAPLAVNAAAGKATNLDADRLDGKDSAGFFSGKTYPVEVRRTGPGGGLTSQQNLLCDEEDVVLGGGGRGQNGEDYLSHSSPFSNGRGWNATIEDNGNPSPLAFEALCADFPPLRP